MDAIQIVTPETIYPPRKRAFRPKSSTGCKTCRIRRIKCDELRPACTQCTRGRRICDGYESSVKNKPFRPSLPLSNQIQKISSANLVPTLAPKLFETETESRFFDFFILHTIPRLSGPFRSEFWDRSVLQATQHEFVIRHAIVAIAALHKGFLANQGRERDQSWQDDAFAVNHYLKAIQHLVAPVGSDKENQLTDVALMTSVLFVCFEVLRGFHGAALYHIDGGIKLFNQLQASSGNTATRRYASVPVFTQVLARLDSQASSITHDRPRSLLSTPLSPCEKLVPEPKVVCFLKSPFTSVEEARSALDKIQNAAVRASSAIMDPTLVFDYASSEHNQKGMTLRKGYSMLRMKQWLARFNEYIQAYQKILNVDDFKAIEILRIAWVVMSINFRIDFVAVTTNEALWDVYLPEFTAIVKHAQRFAQLENEVEKNAPIFTLDMEIIMPLYFVTAKCRDGKLRREAIDILKKRERQEGIWNATLTSRLAERLVIMEEDGLNRHGGVKMGDVKRERRVQGVEVKWNLEKRRVKLTYRCMDVENGGKGTVEVNGNVPMKYSGHR